MIEVKNLTIRYQNDNSTFTAVDNISFNVKKGEIYGVIGLSGAGKSTLIRSINGLQKVSKGSIIVDGKDIVQLDEKQLNEIRKEMSMIFQSFNLFNQKTVYKNIAYPLEISGYSKDEIKKRVEELLSFVELIDKRDEYPVNLSGGQKQRVAIARALAVNPKILLSDESTSALDPSNTKMILKLLEKAVKEFGLTIILITHQMEVAKSICDRIAVMEKGRIVEENSVEELFTNPKHSITKSFIRGNDENIKEKEEIKMYSKRFTLSFSNQIVKKPIVSEVIRNTLVDINIIRGNINELKSQNAGFLIVDIIGPQKEVDKALEIIKNHGVYVEEYND